MFINHYDIDFKIKNFFKINFKFKKLKLLYNFKEYHFIMKISYYFINVNQ